MKFLSNLWSLLSCILISWGLRNSLPNAMSIVSRSYFSMINLYSIGPTVKSVDVETIRHKRNSDTESNDNTSRSVIFEEWEELEAISASVLL